MHSTCRSWNALPMDFLALVVNGEMLTRQDQGSTRLVCRSWCHMVSMTVSRLAPRCQSPSQFAQLPTTFPLLTALEVHKFDHRLFDHKLLFNESDQLLVPLVEQLSNLPSLTHISFSTQWAREMGRKCWACWMVSQLPHHNKMNVQAVAPVDAESPRQGAESALQGSEPAVPGAESAPEAPESVTGAESRQLSAAASSQSHAWQWLQTHCCQPESSSMAILFFPPCLSQLQELRSLSICPDGSETWGVHSSSLLYLPPTITSRLRALDLSGSALGQLPAEVVLHAGCALTCLRMKRCRITRLSADVAGLHDLVRLDVGGNMLKALPKALGQLSGLEELRADRNMLASIPREALSGLTRLSLLDLSHNQLPAIPRGLHMLQSLRTLVLSHNWLKGLQDDGGEICALRGLARLEVANVSSVHNFLTLPAEMVLLSNLQDISVGDNFITPGSLAHLEDLTGLTRLQLNRLKLDQVPRQVSLLVHLRHLDLSYNALTALPPFMSALTRLRFLDIRSNRLGDRSLLQLLSDAGLSKVAAGIKCCYDQQL